MSVQTHLVAELWLRPSRGLEISQQVFKVILRLRMGVSTLAALLGRLLRSLRTCVRVCMRV